MTADEVVADVRAALGLSDEEVITRIVVLAEFADLSPMADQPETPRLATVACDATAPWHTIGMCEFAAAEEHASLRRVDRDDD